MIKCIDDYEAERLEAQWREKEMEEIKTFSCKKLALFMKNGTTLMFSGVTDFRVMTVGKDTEVFKFNYYGASTEMEMSATFNKEEIAGYSIGGMYNGK